jgi:H+-translocating NAD(P) transhydrogenase subunit alpha
MVVGILKEPEQENRVAILPELLPDLKRLNIEVLVEHNAGARAFRSDADYQEAGATVLDRQIVIEKSDILVSIHPPGEEEWHSISADKILMAVFNPLQHTEKAKKLLQKGITAFSLDMLPRTTRAQSMDILSSMATVAGYKAVLTAANHLPQFFPMFMTAAGTISPAKVLILGAGVAGLQAIATARKLGAVVHVFDVRSAVKEEVMSLGGKFIEVEGARDEKSAGGYAVEQGEDYLARQRQAIHDTAIKCQVVICTAQIPGRKAPVLLQEDTVKQMQPGSVIVDLAAATGGNCALTQNDTHTVVNGVTIIGNSNLPSSMPADSSRMFGKNLLNYLKLFVKDGQFQLNMEDDIVEATCISHQGNIPSTRLRDFLSNQK